MCLRLDERCKFSLQHIMSLQEAKKLEQEREAKEEAAEVKRYRRSLTFKVSNSDRPLNTCKLRGFATHMLQRMQLTKLIVASLRVSRRALHQN